MDSRAITQLKIVNELNALPPELSSYSSVFNDYLGIYTGEYPACSYLKSECEMWRHEREDMFLSLREIEKGDLNQVSLVSIMLRSEEGSFTV